MRTDELPRAATENTASGGRECGYRSVVVRKWLRVGTFFYEESRNLGGARLALARGGRDLSAAWRIGNCSTLTVAHRLFSFAHEK